MGVPAGHDDRGRVAGRLQSIRQYLKTHNIAGQRLSEFQDDGWDVPDDCPPWNRTVVASWTPPRLNWTNFSMAVGLTAIFTVPVASWSLGHPSPGDLLLLAWPAIPGVWVWRQLKRRGPKASLELVLGPDRLRLSSDQSNIPAVELWRDRAGLLMAGERGYDWHTRRLILYDDRGNRVAEFVGKTAVIRVDGPVDNTPIPSKVPVAVLVGSWWPHPAHRSIRAGSVGAEFYWKDPDISGFVGWERGQRQQWAAVLGVFGAIALIAGLADTGDKLGSRLLAGIIGCLVLACAAKLAYWRPVYATTASGPEADLSKNVSGQPT